MITNRKFKILPILAVATLAVAGLASCSSSDSSAKPMPNQETDTSVSVQDEGSGTEEPSSEAAEAGSIKGGGFLEIEMDQSEIDRLDAEGASISLANPEAVNPAFIKRDDEGVLWVRISLAEPQFDEVLEEVGTEAKVENRIRMGYGEAIHTQDLDRWLTRDQISGLSCVAQGEAIMLSLEGFTGESPADLLTTKALTGKTIWYAVSPSCQEKEISRKSTVSYAIHIVHLEGDDS